MSQDPLDHVEIYTDGACSGNPGPGGWAAILKVGAVEKELAGFARETTNNRMELTAVIEGLKALKRRCRVTVFADSAYIINCFRDGWIENWLRDGWRRGPRKNAPVQNAELWQTLWDLVQQHEVTFEKVRGHAGHKYNERADRLAVQQIKLAHEK